MDSSLRFWTMMFWMTCSGVISRSGSSWRLRWCVGDPSIGVSIVVRSDGRRLTAVTTVTGSARLRMQMMLLNRMMGTEGD